MDGLAKSREKSNGFLKVKVWLKKWFDRRLTEYRSSRDLKRGTAFKGVVYINESSVSSAAPPAEE